LWWSVLLVEETQETTPVGKGVLGPPFKV
jgi:hypothetical protein